MFLRTQQCPRFFIGLINYTGMAILHKFPFDRFCSQREGNSNFSPRRVQAQKTPELQFAIFLN